MIKAATHRIYESGVAGNLGNDPTGASGLWIDIGPTNRWAMFNQALGTATQLAGSVKVALDAGAVDAVALLDVTGDTVRVQAPSYDRTMPIAPGALTFLDLTGAAGLVTVTVTGSAVAVGTLLVGTIAMLGVTEASPTAAITDFSRKVVDDFGEVTIVERAWAKRMTANALIRTDAVDQVAGRIAAVRAQPSLWIGQKGFDSLTLYGFFKDFSIEVGEVSTLSLSIEGLSTAGKVEPFRPGIDWPEIGDPDGTKPADNADVTGENTSKDTKAIGGVPVTDLLTANAAFQARVDILDRQTIPPINTAVASANTAITAERADAAARINEATATLAEADADIIRRVDTVVSDFQGANSATNIRITDNVAVLANADTALGQRIDRIEATGSYDDTSVRAEISRVDTTAISRDGAITSRIDTAVSDYTSLNTATNDE